MTLEQMLKLAQENGLIRSFAFNGNHVEVKLPGCVIITTAAACRDKLLQCGVDITPPEVETPVEEVPVEEAPVEEPGTVPPRKSKRKPK
jgi:hypothetical protein